MDELRAVLELATEDDLRHLTEILFCRKFNPLDYWQTPDPIEVESQDWSSWIDTVEKRFRYLGADGLTVLRKKSNQVSYRQILIRVCQYLKISYSNQMTTTDIEADIFLYLVRKAWKKLPLCEQKTLTEKIELSLVHPNWNKPCSANFQKNYLSLLLKSGSVIAVNSVVKPWLLKHIAQQFVLHFARYQVAKQAVVGGGAVAANQIILKTARRGMMMTAASYGTFRGVFAFVGPVLWGYFLADLGWRTIATNHSRIIPVIFALAQIRLTRTEYLETT
ncbi:YaaW family protein [Cyanobacterium sp. uoEpiScrs1]|uniref:YaaW family protein n=1 Tax=Cyanobacterium sp. uoEpiScrs1 TaxID=2976343 RepID=UPI00226A547B|nr:hypothetical protein [Cyanobacterium sp. uoEpiScrs1]